MRPNESTKQQADGSVSVLVAVADHDQREAICELLARSTWNVTRASSLDEAVTKLRTERIGVVIACFRGEGSFCWRDVLDASQGLEAPPAIVVTDCLSDEWLWAEVLGAGGYDVLPQPFDAREAFFLISAAWRFWRLGRRKSAAIAGGFAA